MLFILVNKEINIKEYYIQLKKTVFIGFITLLGSMFYGQQTPNLLSTRGTINNTGILHVIGFWWVP